MVQEGIETRKLKEILKNASEKPITYEEAKFLFQLPLEKFEIIQKAAFNIRLQHFGRILRSYSPGTRFPSISLTGSECSLSCAHCDKHYLEYMLDGSSPEKLLEICYELEKNGAIGCLLSGGLDENAAIPFEKFLDAIAEIKKETNLVLNAHTGLLSRSIAQKLGKIGVDVASVDVIGDERTIKEVYGLNKTPEDYFNNLMILKQSGISYIAPHICLGVHYGKIVGELDALEMARQINPDEIVIIGLIPTRETLMEHTTAPSPEIFAQIVAIARLMFPKTPLSVGCMRPKGRIRIEIDKQIIKSGADRLELPTRSALRELTELNLEIKKIEACCTIPKWLEPKIS
ncbi:MAG: radical SAM protein [Promethearchaeota archaeon]